MKTFSAFDEDNLFTYLSDEALETAGGHELAGNFTLGSCTGLSVCPGGPVGLINSSIGGVRVKQLPELD